MNKKNFFEIINNSYILNDTNTIITPNTSWFLLKPSKMEFKNNRYKMSPGEVIKIGRITLRIRDIKFANNSTSTNTQLKVFDDINTLKTEGGINASDKTKPIIEGNNQKKPNIFAKNKNIENQIFSKLEKKGSICRICYMEEETGENPFIHPCTCTGSMKFIHLKCLKKWISNKSCVKIDTTDNCIVYIIKPVECELCKTKFPDMIRHDGKLYHLLDFSQEFENYLTLESLTLDKHKNKFIYVVSLKNNSKMKVGRGRDSDVLLSDISVSRIHCYIIIENKKVYIEDNNSKFGTLILIQSPNLRIVEGIPLNMQVGRTYFECKLKKNYSLFSCCNIEEKSNLFIYYNQNEKQIQEHINLIVKGDYNDLEENEKNKNNQINNTFQEIKPLDMVTKYNYNSLEFNDKIDKISDNEYFMIKHHKLNKIATKALIDEDEYEEKIVNNEEKIENNEEKIEGQEEKKEDKERENNEGKNQNTDNENKTLNRDEFTNNIMENNNHNNIDIDNNSETGNN